MARWTTKKQVTFVTKLVSVAIVLAVAGVLVWLSLPMQAEKKALDQSTNLFTVKYIDTPDAIILNPTFAASKGIVVYPGVRVDPAAYAYKMSAVALQGVAVVIVKPLLNFPLADMHDPLAFMQAVPSVQEWYAAGHSAGGVKACGIAKDFYQFKGLILLGSYCSADISASTLPVLSLSGANDAITSRDDIESNKHSLPATVTFETIEGLNHAGFGNYGSQNGDGELTLDSNDARQKIADAIIRFINNAPR